MAISKSAAAKANDSLRLAHSLPPQLKLCTLLSATTKIEFTVMQHAETESAPNVVRLLSAKTECPPKVPIYPYSAPKPKPNRNSVDLYRKHSERANHRQIKNFPENFRSHRKNGRYLELPEFILISKNISGKSCPCTRQIWLGYLNLRPRLSFCDVILLTFSSTSQEVVFDNIGTSGTAQQYASLSAPYLVETRGVATGGYRDISPPKKKNQPK